jgi:hypothetical protein
MRRTGNLSDVCDKESRGSGAFKLDSGGKDVTSSPSALGISFHAQRTPSTEREGVGLVSTAEDHIWLLSLLCSVSLSYIPNLLGFQHPHGKERKMLPCFQGTVVSIQYQLNPAIVSSRLREE